MEPLHVFLTATAMALLALFTVFLYNREVRNGIIMTDLREDHEQTKKAIRSCTPADAEALIMRFEDKWARYVDPYTLHNYTSDLYQTIFNQHGREALN